MDSFYRFVIFVATFVQLLIPVLILMKILQRSMQKEEFWMSGLLEMLRDESILSRTRWEIDDPPEGLRGQLETKKGRITYECINSNSAVREAIVFQELNIWLLFEAENLVQISSVHGHIHAGDREKITAKHLLGIVAREVQLAKRG